jgi:hypothetical protein
VVVSPFFYWWSCSGMYHRCSHNLPSGEKSNPRIPQIK